MKGENSHLNIQKGGEQQPESINRRFVAKRRPQRSVEDFVSEILKGNRIVLSQAITLIESEQPTHQITAQAIIEGCLPHSGNAVRVGITGTPGVGKSTFIEAMGELLTARGRRLAVLAIDPTSQLSKGSILGDKTRMATLASNPNAYIRPSAAGDSLGGVARKTRETVILCEAAGFDTILIETVGVGQSEVAVHSMVDFFLLLLLPGGGDELQSIKRGVVEMADLIAINKADGDNLQRAKQSRRAYLNGLHLFPPKESGWIPQAVVCSALSKMGLDDIWQFIETYSKATTQNGYFQQNRQKQATFWFQESLQNSLKQRFETHPSVKNSLPSVREAVQNGTLSPFKAAQDLLDLFFSS